MARNQSWLADAYTASKVRPPTDYGSTAPAAATTGGLPPSMMLGATPRAPATSVPAAPAGGAGPLAGMPALGGGGATAAPTVQPGMMRGLLAALQHAHAADTNGNGVPDAQEAQPPTGVTSMPSLSTSAVSSTPATTAPTLSRSPISPGKGGTGTTPPPTGTAPPPTPSVTPTAPPPATVVPPGGPNPQPGDPGYIGPGAERGPAFDSPSGNQKAFVDWLNANGWKGWNEQGPLLNSTPGSETANWLSYILADPYNRMITNASERQTLENTNTAFDAARGKMRADQLQSGAGESGVARGASAGAELARGQTQAKNVRDYEQYKVDTGDKRLQELGLPYLNLGNAARGHAAAPPSQDKTQQYLQYAGLIASLFA